MDDPLNFEDYNGPKDPCPQCTVPSLELDEMGVQYCWICGFRDGGMDGGMGVRVPTGPPVLSGTS